MVVSLCAVVSVSCSLFLSCSPFVPSPFSPPPALSLACCCRPVRLFLLQSRYAHIHVRPAPHISFASGFGSPSLLCFCGRASCVEISSFALSFLVSPMIRGRPLSGAVPVVLFPPSPLLLEWDWSACLLCCSHVVYHSRMIVDLWLYPDLTSSAPLVFVRSLSLLLPLPLFVPHAIVTDRGDAIPSSLGCVARKPHPL